MIIKQSGLSPFQMVTKTTIGPGRQPGTTNDHKTPRMSNGHKIIEQMRPVGQITHINKVFIIIRTHIKAILHYVN